MDLPESLMKKLEIVPPVITQNNVKNDDENLPINLNPFFKEEQRKQNCENVTNKLFGPKCCYCDNNNTEECSSSNVSSSTRRRNNSNTLEHSLINQPQFKQKNKQIRKILKEPILKDIGKCVHQNNLRNRKLSKLENTNKSDDEKLFGSSQNQDNLDFKTLAIEYSGMSLSASRSSSSSSSSSSLTSGIPNSTGNSFTKNFKTNSSLKSKNEKELNKSFDDTTKSLNQQHHTSRARSTCSQQARINVGCDITIDELAGYFETFVHIPKKMSQMAAEMYM